MSETFTPNTRRYGWQGTSGSPFMADGVTPRCVAPVVRETGLRRIGSAGQCVRAGRYLEPESGRGATEYYWCGVHAPSRVSARYEQRDAERTRKYDEELAARRIKDAAPELLAAAETALAEIRSLASGEPGYLIAAIAKARGK